MPNLKTISDNLEQDEKAIADIREYCSQKQWDALMQLVGHPDTTVQHINFALGLAGISGRPFHAFCRKYLLDKYREWMANGDDAVQTDEHGFRLTEGA